MKKIGKKAQKPKIQKSIVLAIIIAFALIIAFIIGYNYLSHRPAITFPTTTLEPVATSTTLAPTTTLASIDLSPPTTLGQGNIHHVDIINLKFEPLELNIGVGDTVTWTNKDVIGTNARAHMIKERSGLFISPRLLADDSFSYTFNTPGTYHYIDSIFPSGMKAGTINVGEKSLIVGQAVRAFDSRKAPILSVLIIISVFGIVVGIILGFRKPSDEARLFE